MPAEQELPPQQAQPEALELNEAPTQPPSRGRYDAAKEGLRQWCQATCDSMRQQSKATYEAVQEVMKEAIRERSCVPVYAAVR